MKKILQNHYVNLTLNSILAGLAIALGGFLCVTCKAYDSTYGTLLGAICFPIGLILVCFCSFNLYTGKIGYLNFRKSLKNQIIDLIIMLLFNFAACFLVGYIVNILTTNNDTYQNFFKTFYNAKIFDPTFIDILKLFISSFGCGACVYLAVFIFKKSKKIITKIIGIFIPIFLFVFLGMDHCVANAFYYGAVNAFGNYLIYIYLLIVALGNSLSAILLNTVLTKN